MMVNPTGANAPNTAELQHHQQYMAIKSNSGQHHGTGATNTQQHHQNNQTGNKLMRTSLSQKNLGVAPQTTTAGQQLGGASTNNNTQSQTQLQTQQQQMARMGSQPSKGPSNGAKEEHRYFLQQMDSRISLDSYMVASSVTGGAVGGGGGDRTQSRAGGIQSSLTTGSHHLNPPQQS